jgi:hypothetical protein
MAATPAVNTCCANAAGAASDAPKIADIRVAIVAEHASARFGGEALLPLQYFRHLRRRGIDVHLVVHARTRAELEALLPDERDRIHYAPETRPHRLLLRLGRKLPDRVRRFTASRTLEVCHQRRPESAAALSRRSPA